MVGVGRGSAARFLFLANLLLVPVLAGCLAPEPTPAMASVTNSKPAATGPGVVDWSGAVRTSACVPVGVNACAGASLGDDEQAHHFQPHARGDDVRVTLYWNATTPMFGELAMSLSRVHVEDCGENCKGQRFERIAKAQGPSPLVVGVSDLDLEHNATLRVYVWPLRQTPEPVLAHVHVQQPFHVVGRFT